MPTVKKTCLPGLQTVRSVIQGPQLCQKLLFSGTPRPHPPPTSGLTETLASDITL